MRWVVVLAVAAGVAGCGGDGGAEPRATPEPEPAAATPSPAAAYEVVEITTEDGVKLTGRAYGKGETAVVLVHGLSERVAQDDWFEFPQELEDRGQQALTINLRGFCDSEGDCSEGERDHAEIWRDVAAAADFARERGAEKVVLVGASLGGLAVLRAAQGIEVDGVVSLATPQFPARYYGDPAEMDLTPARLRQIKEPKLFIAGRDDVQTGEPFQRVKEVRFAADARRMHSASREPKQLAILDSDRHSSDLLTIDDEANMRRAKRLLFRFIDGV